jgi:hypothetical protein
LPEDRRRERATLSQQNIFTGKLIPAMVQEVLMRA